MIESSHKNAKLNAKTGATGTSPGKVRSPLYYQYTCAIIIDASAYMKF